VARECDGPDRGAMNTVCPLQCRVRYGAANGDPLSDQASAPGQVEWAGLLVNLDLAFSTAQRDKVYVQHLMRKRGAQLWRWLQDGAPVCVCDIAAKDGYLDADAAESISSR
jgi:hypothetical protein